MDTSVNLRGRGRGIAALLVTRNQLQPPMAGVSISQEQTQLLPPGLSPVAPSVKVKGRGRGAAILERLKYLRELREIERSMNRINITQQSSNCTNGSAINHIEKCINGLPIVQEDKKFTKDPFLSPANYVGSAGVHRSVISNALPLKCGIVYEYYIEFQPSVEDENSRARFLKWHFDRIGQQYIDDGSFVLVPKELKTSELECILPDQIMHQLVILRLIFKQQTSFGTNFKLTNKILKNICDSALTTVCTKSNRKIIRNYLHTVRQTKDGQMLFLDSCYYIVHNKSIAEELPDLRREYPESYCRALTLFLSKVYVYCKTINKICKFCIVIWESSMLKLQNKEHFIDVAFEDCYMAEIGFNISSYASESPTEHLSNIKELIAEEISIWNINCDSFKTSKVHVLPPETVIFGDGVTCTPKDGCWLQNMLENEVVTSIELWCWVILHAPSDLCFAEMLSYKMQQLRDDTGVNIGKALLFPVKSDSLDGYVNALEEIISDDIKLVVVLTPSDSINKPERLIKHICFVQKPVVCQIISALDVYNAFTLHQTAWTINAMLGGTLWTVDLPCKNKNWMIVGVNVHRPLDSSAVPVCSFVTTFSNDATQWYSKAAFLEQTFDYYLKVWLIDTLKKYRSTNGILPTCIIIYHICTEETRNQTYTDYQNFPFAKHIMQEFSTNDLKICVILVQKYTNTCYYKNLKAGYFNVPTGTIVDETITNFNSRDFYLISRPGSNKEMARPAYYEVIKDDCNFTPDEIQILTYKLCYLYYKDAQVAEMPAPCMYAERLSIVVADTIQWIPSPVLDEYLYYL